MKLYWLDLETTGLDSLKDNILEVAVAEAEFETPFEIKHIYQNVIRFRENEHDPLNAFVKQMHTKNNLLKECNASFNILHNVEKDLLKLIYKASSKDDMPILAGSCIYFDFMFLKTYMPNLAERFSHRLYDISSLKLFCQSIGMPKLPKAEAHRAKDVIEESAAHGKLCQEWLEKTWYLILNKQY